MQSLLFSTVARNAAPPRPAHLSLHSLGGLWSNPTLWWSNTVNLDTKCQGTGSLRSKRFRLVSRQKMTVERDFRFWPREKWNENQKMKEGEGRGEGGFPSFLPHPLPALLLAPILERSLTLVPHSLLLNRTETLATQAKRLGKFVR